MSWAVYADLSRELTVDERGAVVDALDELVPNSGCVGRPERGTVEEMYFEVEAHTDAEARERAARYVDAVLDKAGVTVTYEITLQVNANGG